MKIHTILFINIFCISVLGYAQTTETISPDSYNTIYESSATDNVSNGAGTYLFAGRASRATNSIRRGLLHFDLSSLPSDIVITDATLTLNMSRTISGAMDVSLHKATQNWGQGTSDAEDEEGKGASSTQNDASWNCSFSTDASSCTTSWTTIGGDFEITPNATTSVSGNGSYTWTSAAMIATIQEWIDTPSNNFGWFIIGEEESSRTAKRFDITTNIPTLEITYTPVTLGIVENDFDDTITVFPNPTSLQTSISFGKTYTNIDVTIRNILGQVITQFQKKSVSSIEIELLGNPGIYFVELISDTGKKATAKVLKQ